MNAPQSASLLDAPSISPWAFRQRIAVRKRKLTTTRSTLMRHTLSYRGRLESSNAKVAFVRANFTAGRGAAWEGGWAPRSGIEESRGGLQATAKSWSCTEASLHHLSIAAR